MPYSTEYGGFFPELRPIFLQFKALLSVIYIYSPSYSIFFVGL